MNNNGPVKLPSAILSSNDYGALNASQRENFLARIAHCLEVANAGTAAASLPDSELFGAIDDIELDALSIMSAFSDPSKTVSPYQIHSSWIFTCDRNTMASYVDKTTSEFLARPVFLLESDAFQLKRWLQEWAYFMRATQSRLAGSSSFTEAIAQLIVVDALIAALLVFAAATRLNTRFS